MQDLISPQMLKIAGLIQDAEFQQAALAISSNPNLKWLYAGFLLVVIIYMLFKRWVLSSTDRWYWRLVLRIPLVLLFFLGQFAVSYAALQKPLLVVLTKIIRLEYPGFLL